MGENIKTHEQQSSADRLREQIRHTESDITETVNALEHRLSPSYLRDQGVRSAKRAGWQGAEKLLGAVQRTPVQLSVLGAGALLMLFSNRKVRDKVSIRRSRAPEKFPTTAAARAVGATALWLLSRKEKQGEKKGERAHKPAVSRAAWAATAAKAFMTGANASSKKGNTRPGRKEAWRGLATAIGSALGSYWYSHRGHRV
jgi:hypothetical protein